MTTPVWAPLCIVPVDWAHWQRSNPVKANVGAARPCDDCPLGFAAEMRSVGKCNGVPMGAEEEDETVMSDEPKAKPWEMPPTIRTREAVRMSSAVAALTGKELPVALAIPCGRCIHAPVCRIKPTIEARLETLPVSLPALDPAIKVTLSATVECSQFHRASSAGSGRRMSPEGIARITASNRARAERQRAARAAAG